MDLNSIKINEIEYIKPPTFLANEFPFVRTVGQKDRFRIEVENTALDHMQTDRIESNRRSIIPSDGKVFRIKANKNRVQSSLVL